LGVAWSSSWWTRCLRGAGIQVNSPVVDYPCWPNARNALELFHGWSTKFAMRSAVYDCQSTASTATHCRAPGVYCTLGYPGRFALATASSAAFGRGRGRIYQSTLCDPTHPHPPSGRTSTENASFARETRRRSRVFRLGDQELPGLLKMTSAR
jgi:hypothetical protein